MPAMDCATVWHCAFVYDALITAKGHEVNREIIEVPVISEALRNIGAPVSPLVRCGPMLYTCGMPPIDIRTGEIVRGDIAVQTRASLDALAFTLEFGGSSLAQVVKATVYIADNNLAGAMNEVY